MHGCLIRNSENRFVRSVPIIVKAFLVRHLQLSQHEIYEYIKAAVVWNPAPKTIFFDPVRLSVSLFHIPLTINLQDPRLSQGQVEPKVKGMDFSWPQKKKLRENRLFASSALGALLKCFLPFTPFCYVMFHTKALCNFQGICSEKYFTFKKMLFIQLSEKGDNLFC